MRTIQNIDQDSKVESLAFKHEDEERGHAIGPVWAKVVGQEELVPVAEREDTNAAGETERWTVWYPLAQARGMAEALGVELSES